MWFNLRIHIVFFCLFSSHCHSSCSPKMNFEDLTHDICRLVDDNNRWSSVLEIPQGDGFLNISSALQDDLSLAPIGAINQPDMLPIGKSASFYRFDPELFYGEQSWPKLKKMLLNSSRASGFWLITTHCSRQVTLHRKVTYELCCSHGLSVKMASESTFVGDDVGASNVRKERIKHVKSFGAIRGMSLILTFVSIRITISFCKTVPQFLILLFMLYY